MCPTKRTHRKDIMEIENLEKRISEEESRVKAAKTKRDVLATVVFAAAYFLILGIFGNDTETLYEYCQLSVVSVVLGVLHHSINSVVYEDLFAKDRADRWLLEHLKKELDERQHN